MISESKNMLRVDLEDFEEYTAYAEYNTFEVKSENDKRRLIRDSYSGITVLFHFVSTTQQITQYCTPKKFI